MLLLQRCMVLGWLIFLPQHTSLVHYSRKCQMRQVLCRLLISKPPRRNTYMQIRISLFHEQVIYCTKYNDLQGHQKAGPKRPGGKRRGEGGEGIYVSPCWLDCSLKAYLHDTICPIRF